MRKSPCRQNLDKVDSGEALAARAGLVLLGVLSQALPVAPLQGSRQVQAVPNSAADLKVAVLCRNL
jgi:hypothetical protein